MPTAPSNVTESHERKPDIISVEPQIEPLEATKPTEAPSTDREDVTPQLKRNETTESWYTDDMGYVRRNAPRSLEPYDEFTPSPHLPCPVRRAPQPPTHYQPPPPPPAHYEPSLPPPLPPTVHIPSLTSSVKLLEQLDYDGLANLPHPAGSSIYITTFPFTDKEVKEWSWLFQLGIEGKFLSKQGDPRDDDDGDDEDDWLYPGDHRGRIAIRSVPHHRRRRDHSSMYPFDSRVEISSVYLSRALDAAVVPESSEKDFTFVIVVRNRGRAGGGVKLLTAGSRKAAGILIYYEVLAGHSVVFVGAMKEGVEKGTKAWKYKRAENVEVAGTMADDGVVGVIC